MALLTGFHGWLVRSFYTEKGVCDDDCGRRVLVRPRVSVKLYRSSTEGATLGSSLL